ncbi:hypothetical protein ACWF94_03490 [Streptomyces sp. NPDC055078]
MAYGERVYKVKNGKQTKQFTWRCRYKKPDGTGSEPGFPTKKTAEDWGNEQEAAIRAGTWIDPDLMRMPFGKFARKFMEARQKRGRTVDTRWRNLEKYILPKWETTPLISINWFDVDSWQLTLPCDKVTAGHCVSLMSTILTAAVDARHLPVNPLVGRRRSQGIVTEPTAKPQTRKAVEDRWHTAESVLRVAERLGPAKGLHVITTAWTGLCWGEGVGLHRDRALLTRRQEHDGGWYECPILRIDQEVAEYEQRGEDGKKLGTVLQLEPVKTEWRVRDLDLAPFLARLWRYHLADWTHPYVLSTPSEGKWWRRGNWGKQLRPAADGRPERLKRQGVSAREKWEPIAPGMTMRDLRHTHDTWQEQIGVKAPLAFEQAGHKRPGIKAVYQHPTPTMRQVRLEGLQEIYERAMRNIGLTTLWGRVDLVKHPKEDDLLNPS